MRNEICNASAPDPCLAQHVHAPLPTRSGTALQQRTLLDCSSPGCPEALRPSIPLHAKAGQLTADMVVRCGTHFSNEVFALPPVLSYL